MENYSWRQPIPTDLNFGEDESSKTVFILLLLSAANSPQAIQFREGYCIQLQRGQSIFGRKIYAKKLGLKKNETGRVTRILNRLVNQHNKITIKPNNICTVVTIKNYDQLIQMNSQTDNKQASNRHPVVTHKSDKSVKNKKSINKKNKNIEELLSAIPGWDK